MTTAAQGGHPRFYELLDQMAEVHSAKNHDYSSVTDPLRNLRQCRDMGIDPWVGVVVRLTDKMDRLKSFAKSRTLAVESEKIQDTLIDMANYALLAIILLDEGCNSDQEAAESNGTKTAA